MDVLVCALQDVSDGQVALAGGKGANLAKLARGGFPVPPGFIVTTRAYDLAVDRAELGERLAALAGLDSADPRAVASASGAIREAFAAAPLPAEVSDAVLAAYRQLGAGPVAVRSSATAEDLADAAFAGQQESYLNVVGEEAVLDAVRRCWGSLWTERAIVYRARRRVDPRGLKLAVVVQRMVPAEVGGVLFTANPLTGARDELVLDASPGLGEAVVAGLVTPDHVVLDKHTLAITERQPGRREVLIRPLPAGGTERVQLPAPARPEACLPDAAIAELARLAVAVERNFGVPQDVEWAWAGGTPYLLQARPMTALPEPVAWVPPSPGYWMRNFRLGEWLPEPLTPLFRDWLLERIEAGYLLGMRRTIGTALPFPHATINGWYYTAAPRVAPRMLLRAAVGSRGRIFPFVLNALIRVGSKPEVADRRILRGLAEAWRWSLLPRYEQEVEQGARRVDDAGPEELTAMVDRLGRLAGEYLWSLAIVGGSAWKMEGGLARFVRRHVAPGAGSGVPGLLRGLPDVELDVPTHAVQSADWYRPTAGELGWAGTQADVGERRRRLVAEREAAEAACRRALAGTPALRARFDTLLALARRYAALREAQARQFTLGWPLLRRCALRLGASLRARGALARPEDVFFLTRAELESTTDLREVVSRRRATWERQRRLVAPLAIGTPPRLLEHALSGTAEAVGTSTRAPEGAITGQPASPGRAAGAVRIVRGPEDFARFRVGEILVTSATTPAWTPLFVRAAAVVTDGGTLAAHASLVAREYGIPAVVGTGDATTRLRDGQVVTVDGGAGVVELVES
jgi:phosphohistidine swiveling domain-containing protein